MAAAMKALTNQQSQLWRGEMRHLQVQFPSTMQYLPWCLKNENAPRRMDFEITLFLNAAHRGSFLSGFRRNISGRLRFHKGFVAFAFACSWLEISAYLSS